MNFYQGTIKLVILTILLAVLTILLVLYFFTNPDGYITQFFYYWNKRVFLCMKSQLKIEKTYSSRQTFKR